MSESNAATSNPPSAVELAQWVELLDHCPVPEVVDGIAPPPHNWNRFVLVAQCRGCRRVVAVLEEGRNPGVGQDRRPRHADEGAFRAVDGDIKGPCRFCGHYQAAGVGELLHVRWWTARFVTREVGPEFSWLNPTTWFGRQIEGSWHLAPPEEGRR